MSKLRCIIIDDEKLARTLLKKYIQEVPELLLVGSFKSALNSQKLIFEKQVDLIFLDIQMPDISGLDFFQNLENKPMVIFTTAYPNYALDGFNLDAIDYLLKPFRFERFQEAVNKALRQFNWMEGQKKLKETTSKSDFKNEQNFILVKSEYKVFKIKHNEILYIEGMKEYVAFHLKEQRVMSLMSLKNLEEILPEEHFIRVHRSYIVNINHIISKKTTQIFIGKKNDSNWNSIPKNHSRKIILKVGFVKTI